MAERAELPVASTADQRKRSSERFLGLSLALVISCGADAGDVFEGEVAPVFEHRCASTACHGVGPDEPWPDAEGLFFRVDRDGLLTDLPAAREAARTRIVTEGPALLSSLVHVPLAAHHGGGPHAGGGLFMSTDDPALLAVIRWIDLEPDGTGGEDLELTALEEQFAAEVLPILVSRCAFGGCHGPTDTAFTAFAARPDPASGEFAPKAIRATYGTARKHLDLWSARPELARLLRKALGTDSSGLIHRGGGATFFPDAPIDRPLEAEGPEAILRWARAERDALGVGEGFAPTALVFVRGEPSPRSPFRIAPGEVGSDLYVTPWPVVAGAEENLTASLHPGQDVEIRDPAVAHDGRRVAFALRRAAEDRFSLWEIDLEERTPRQITASSEAGSFVGPTYAPDGRIIAVWDGHGEAGTDGPGTPPDLVAVDPADGSFERITFTPVPEVEPAFLAAGKTRGEVVFGTRRYRLPSDGVGMQEGVLFRFPLCHDPAFHGEPEYHVHFGASVAPRVPFIARDLPDGRQIVLVLDDAEAADDRGRLAILDRSLAPAVPDALMGSATVGGFRQPLRDLDLAAGFRDPAVLPNGELLASADDEGAAGEDAIYRISFLDTADGPTITARERLLGASGASFRSPTPVFSRPLEDEHEPIVDPVADTGFLILRDVAVLEALYGRAEPLGTRPMREEISYIRLLSLSGTPASAMGAYPDGGTRYGLAAHPPAELLAEVPLPADRSAWIRIPARQPVLLQWLDARKMVIGNQLDRYYFAEGDEIVPGGTNAVTYDHNCSGCHGTRTGVPEAPSTERPDAVSAASVTMARYADRDRRRPLDPFDAAGPTQPIDYARDVAPLFAASCVDGECHGGTMPAAGLALDDRPGTGRFVAAYQALLDDGYVDAARRRGRASALVERLLGEELDAPAPVTGRCPPEGADPELVDTVVRWIELGAFYDLEAP